MKKQRGFTVLELMILCAGLTAIALACTGVYVIFHFIAKFW